MNQRDVWRPRPEPGEGGKEAQEQYQYLLEAQEQLEDRLIKIENSALFRLLRWVGATATNVKLRMGRALLQSGLHRFVAPIVRQRTLREDILYSSWSAAHDQALQKHLSAMRGNGWKYCPRFSIVIPSYRSVRNWFEAAVASVYGQSYPHWELCIAVDDGAEPWLRDYLLELSTNDPRIKISILSSRKGISGALNEAVALTNGDYLAFLDHDDVLSPFALESAVDALQEASDGDILYSDEDHLNERGLRTHPRFKPDWSPDLLTSCMYFGHLLIVRRQKLLECGGFRSEYDGAQDYDLVLRLTGAYTAKVLHLPYVLYHWRAHRESTAKQANAKPYAHGAGRAALQASIERRGVTGCEIEDGPSAHSYRVRWPIGRSPSQVTIVICSRTPRLLRESLESLWQRNTKVDIEVIVVQHSDGQNDQSMRTLLASRHCRSIPYRGAFNFAVMNNLAAAEARSDSLIFLNDDVVGASEDWVLRLLGQMSRPSVGVCGALLLYPTLAIQHAGMVLGIGDGTAHVGRHVYDSDLWPWLRMTRNVGAVTGACLGIRKGVFGELGGFDRKFPVNFNDSDLCLRARAAGYEVVVETGAVLIHRECATRSGGTRVGERVGFAARWGGVLRRGDPFYSPNLSRAETIELRAVD